MSQWYNRNFGKISPALVARYHTKYKLQTSVYKFREKRSTLLRIDDNSGKISIEPPIDRNLSEDIVNILKETDTLVLPTVPFYQREFGRTDLTVAPSLVLIPEIGSPKRSNIISEMKTVHPISADLSLKAQTFESSEPAILPFRKIPVERHVIDESLPRSGIELDMVEKVVRQTSVPFHEAWDRIDIIERERTSTETLERSLLRRPQIISDVRKDLTVVQPSEFEERTESSFITTKRRVRISEIVNKLDFLFNQKFEPLKFIDLCPPSMTNRMEAASTFSILIELHDRKKIHLENEIEGISSSNILIFSRP